MVEELTFNNSATFTAFNPLSINDSMVLFSSEVSSFPLRPMLVVYIDNAYVAEVMTTSGLHIDINNLRQLGDDRNKSKSLNGSGNFVN
jgi:hypothetical protein